MSFGDYSEDESAAIAERELARQSRRFQPLRAYGRDDFAQDVRLAMLSASAVGPGVVRQLSRRVKVDAYRNEFGREGQKRLQYGADDPDTIAREGDRPAESVAGDYFEDADEIELACLLYQGWNQPELAAWFGTYQVDIARRIARLRNKLSDIDRQEEPPTRRTDEDVCVQMWRSGMTQRQIADSLGMSQQGVSKRITKASKRT